MHLNGMRALTRSRLHVAGTCQQGHTSNAPALLTHLELALAGRTSKW